MERQRLTARRNQRNRLSVQEVPLESEPWFAPPINGIAHNGMPDERHMNTNLVGAPGFGKCFQQAEAFALRCALVGVQHAILCHGLASAAYNRHPFALVGIPPDGRVNVACLRLRSALNQCEIALLYFPRLELRHEIQAGWLRLCDQDSTRCVFFESGGNSPAGLYPPPPRPY